MFSKLSRYRKLDDTVTKDAQGRTLASKSLRLLPVVKGKFLHTVEEVDRLDHLAYKYYKQSRHWWRICDANPDILSPRALIGKVPQITVNVPVIWTGRTPPWSELIRMLRRTLGVEAAVMGNPEQPHPDVGLLDDTLLFSLDLSMAEELDASGEAQALTAPLDLALQAEGLSISSAIRLSKEGDTSWYLLDQGDGQLYTFRESEAAIQAYEGVWQYSWVVAVVYNSMDLAEDTLLDMISNATLGFEADTPTIVRRVGKLISIPNRPTL